MGNQKRWLPMFFAVLFFVVLCPPSIRAAKAAEKETEVTLKNPRIADNGSKVTWDCVWFGNYPQGEIGSTDEMYEILENASDWNNNDITIGDEKYRRIKKKDAAYIGSEDYYYQWADDTSWHYFKYEPIKWRVLKVEGNQAFLFADIGLDNQRYRRAIETVSWEKSQIRSWLNGYSEESNEAGADYSGKNFVDCAFSGTQKDAIINTVVPNEMDKPTTDKIFLLSQTEVSRTEEAASYGFEKDAHEDDSARVRGSSDYAKAMGAYSDNVNRNCWWLLRSPGDGSDDSMDGAVVDERGRADWIGYSGKSVGAVCPALNLNLSFLNQYSYAGTVNSKGAIDSEVTWELSEDGTLTISGAGDMDDYNVGGAPWYKRKDEIKKVVVRQGITGIGDRAFYECGSLSEAGLPEGVKNIGDSAFRGCEALSKIELPDSLERVEWGAFINCTNLSNMEIPKNLAYLGGHAFDGCTGLTNMNLPESLTGIEPGVFSGCTNLSEITLPESITKIGEHAFWRCENLSKINIPQNVTAIGEYAFSGCKKLSEMNLPTNLKRIDYYAFSECTGMTKVRLPEGISQLGPGAFSGCSSLLEITLPNSLTEISRWLFKGCSKITKIQLPDSIVEIGGEAFEDCKFLSEIILPQNVKSIGENAFYGCSGMKKIEILNKNCGICPDSDNQDSRKNTIPETATIYGYHGSTAEAYAQEYNRKFVSLDGGSTTETPSTGNSGTTTEIPSTGNSGTTTETPSTGNSGTTTEAPSTGNSGTATETPPIGTGGTTAQQPPATENPGNTTSTGNQGNNGSGGSTSEPPTDNTPLPQKGEKLTDTKTKASYTVISPGFTVAYAGTTNKKATSVTIPKTVKVAGTTYKVTSVSVNAFKNNKKLKKATITGNVVTIGSGAFSGCTSLATVKFGNKVVTIGDKAFFGCKKLSSLTVGKNVASIGKSAFENCSTMKKITIPAKVKKIGSKAFCNCKKLTSIIIQSKNLTAKNVGSKAFAKAGSSNYKKLTIKVPKSKYTAYKKLLSKKGLSKKVKIKK